ncbi:MAG TPA: hypothetical protein VGC66_19130, partial [Pyrinomonadaceae bacterium]
TIRLVSSEGMVSIKDLSWQSGLKLTGLPFCFQRSEMDKVQLRSCLKSPVRDETIIAQCFSTGK